MGVKNKSKEAVIRSIAHSMQVSLESYFLSFNAYPEDSQLKLSQLIEKFNSKGITMPTPKNPFTGSQYSQSDNSGQITYQWNTITRTYTLSGFGVNNSEEIVSVTN